DRMGADYYSCLKEMEEKLHAKIAPCAIPAGQASAFEGIIDVVRMKLIWKYPSDTKNWQFELRDIPAQYQDDARTPPERFMNAVSLYDDGIAEMLMEGKEVPEDRLRAAIRKGTLEGKITPVLTGSSFRFHGVQNLLDAVTQYLPSPQDRPPVKGR